MNKRKRKRKLVVGISVRLHHILQNISAAKFLLLPILGKMFKEREQNWNGAIVCLFF